ncbi:MAG TPA: chemotaxis protein CheD [Candidatus Angelobacter sp.]|nr:chemotaxis protein CheD [Candidatus Angelobacter sp.]
MIPQPIQSDTRQAGIVIHDPRRVFLLPGELHATGDRCEITTILGSCVAVCLWDSSVRAGGMNHFLLPGSQESAEMSSRFGNVATQELLHRLYSLGCQRKSLVAKLFGGAALWQPEGRYINSLGARNVETSQRMMKNCGIHIVAQDTGGNHGRKIIFDTEDGSVWARRI